MRFSRAVAMAADLHQDQVRKGTTVPYVSHLLSVAALVAEDGGSDDEVVAALLHDAAEDQGGEATLSLIGETFGQQVADVVRECSDSITDADADKAPWQERKEAAIAAVAHHSGSALRVIAADKLHNARSTVADLALLGPEVWGRFKTGRDGFVWYHEQMLQSLREHLPGSRSVELLALELEQLDRVERGGQPAGR